MNLHIKAAKIIDKHSPFHLKKQDLIIENGLISNIGKDLKNVKNYKEVQFKNLHLSCGWFDTSVSFGEPGYEERETITKGLEVAAKSGFTTLALNANTKPLIDNKSAVEFLISKCKNSPVSLYPIANLTLGAAGKEMAELFDMKNSGAIAFGDYNQAISNANLMKIALQYAQNFEGLVLSFPQDESINNGSAANEGKHSTRLGLKGNPAIAEEVQIARDLFLLAYTEGKLHIPTISTAGSVKLIAEAKKKGLNVSCSVSAHHLCLTDDTLNGFDTNCKVSPPLRSNNDLKALLKGVQNGTIDMITSDHNPIDIEHKKVEFENALNGTIGLESCFGALGTCLDLESIIEALTSRPRKRFGLESSAIAKGEKANITLFNPTESYTFTKGHILSTSENAAFLGKELKGKVYGIFASNKLILN